MPTDWSVVASNIIDKLPSLKRYKTAIIGFINRVVFLDEHREAKQIENLVAYLEAVSKALEISKAAGASDAELVQLANDLNVPLIQANLEAMILSRGGLGSKRRNADSSQSEPIDGEGDS